MWEGGGRERVKGKNLNFSISINFSNFFKFFPGV
jgi:hypothetical protein